MNEAIQDLINDLKPLISYKRGETVIPVSGMVTLDMKPNVLYVVESPITKLTLNVSDDTKSYDSYYIMFTTDTSGCTVLPPVGWTYLNGSVEAFEPNTIYEFSAVNGKIICPKGTAVS